VGATGGVGSFVVQLARRAGARVVATTATGADAAHVTGLGAAVVVDRTGDLAAQVRDAVGGLADVAIHLAGDPAAALATVRPGGVLVSTLLQSPDQVPADHATVVPVYAVPTRETLTRLAQAQLAGDVRTVIQATYPLESAAQALEAFGAGTLGKIVVEVA